MTDPLGSLARTVESLPTIERSAVELVYGAHRTQLEAAALLHVTAVQLGDALMSAMRTIAATVEGAPSTGRAV